MISLQQLDHQLDQIIIQLVKMFLNKSNQVLKRYSDQVIRKRNGKSYFDLWKANKITLNNVGVNKIEMTEICTICNLNDWYSHRGENGKTGSFGVVIGLSE